MEKRERTNPMRKMINAPLAMHPNRPDKNPNPNNAQSPDRTKNNNAHTSIILLLITEP